MSRTGRKLIYNKTYNYINKYNYIHRCIKIARSKVRFASDRTKVRSHRFASRFTRIGSHQGSFAPFRFKVRSHRIAPRSGCKHDDGNDDDDCNDDDSDDDSDDDDDYGDGGDDGDGDDVPPTPFFFACAIGPSSRLPGAEGRRILRVIYIIGMFNDIQNY